MPLSYLAIKNVSPHSLRTPLDFVAALFVFIHLYSLSVYIPFHLRLRIAIYLWVCYEPTSAVYLGKMVFLLFLTKFHLLACSPFLKSGSRGILIYRLLNGNSELVTIYFFLGSRGKGVSCSLFSSQKEPLASKFA